MMAPPDPRPVTERLCLLRIIPVRDLGQILPFRLRDIIATAKTDHAVQEYGARKANTLQTYV